MSQLAHPVTEAESETALDLGVARPADAAATLFSTYRDRIREYCRSQLHERQEADDALQSTFLYAYMLLERGVTPRRPLPWLYTIAHNVCRTRRRALRQRERVESSVDLDTLQETIGRGDPSRDEHEGLAHALSALPANQRHALVLREWQGLSYAEIATRLCITQSAVETLLFRARRNLARKLRPTADRLASILNGAILLRGARRLLPATATKTTAAAVALTVATGATLVPFVATTPRIERRAPSHHAAVTRATPSPLLQSLPTARARMRSEVSSRDRGRAELTTSSPPPDVRTSATPPAPPTAAAPPAPAASDGTPAPSPAAAAALDGVVKTAQDAVQTVVQAVVSDVAGAVPPVPVSTDATDVSGTTSSVSSAVAPVAPNVPQVPGQP